MYLDICVGMDVRLNKMYLDICVGMDVRLFPLLFAISFFNLEEDSPAYKTFSAADIQIIKTVIWSRGATSTFVREGGGVLLFFQGLREWVQ